MNKTEYNQAVTLYADDLYCFALRYCNMNLAAEDAVQDSFVALWEHRDGVSPRSAKAWLIRVLYRRLVDMHRHDDRVSFSQPAQTESDVNPDSDFDLKDTMQYALAQLPEVQRTLVLLRDLEGYDYAEMADICNISEQQVAVYLYRARKALKKLLENYR